MANLERLKETLRVAKAINPKAFNLDTYGRTGVDYADDWCGTVACIVGWAARDPWHRKQGLDVRPLADGLGSVITYGTQHGWGAPEAFYELGKADYADLFMPEGEDGDDTLSGRIQRLEAFIKFEEGCQNVAAANKAATRTVRRLDLDRP